MAVDSSALLQVCVTLPDESLKHLVTSNMQHNSALASLKRLTNENAGKVRVCWQGVLYPVLKTPDSMVFFSSSVQQTPLMPTGYRFSVAPQVVCVAPVCAHQLSGGEAESEP